MCFKDNKVNRASGCQVNNRCIYGWVPEQTQFFSACVCVGSFFIRDVTKIKLRANVSLSEKLCRNFKLHFMCVDFLWLNVTLYL